MALDTIQYLLGAGSGGLVGFTLGLVGGGGSILAVPLMVYLVGVPQPHIAIGTSALAVAVNAGANLVPQASQGLMPARPWARPWTDNACCSCSLCSCWWWAH